MGEYDQERCLLLSIQSSMVSKSTPYAVTGIVA
jgi:hypothetical protein